MGHEVPVAVSYYSPPLWVIKKKTGQRMLKATQSFTRGLQGRFLKDFGWKLLQKENRQERDVKFDDVVSKAWN